MGGSETYTFRPRAHAPSSCSTRELRVPFKEDRMRAIIFNLDEERGRRRSQEPEVSPSPVSPIPSNLHWKLSQRGNPYVGVNDAFHIVVFRRGSWAFRIEDLRTGQAWFSERRYESEDAARAEALLAVSELRGREPERLA